MSLNVGFACFVSRVPVEFYNWVLSVLEFMMIKKNIVFVPFIFLDVLYLDAGVREAYFISYIFFLYTLFSVL